MNEIYGFASGPDGKLLLLMLLISGVGSLLCALQANRSDELAHDSGDYVGTGSVP